MSYELDEGATGRLRDFFEQIGEILGDRRRRASFAIYAFGILGDGERKSAEPIAARACADPEAAEAMHTQMLTFLSRSNWEDEPVRRMAIGYALGAMQRREEIRAWIVDDTGFLKQGRHSVGVQRQYTGSAGKTTNCQIGVSLTACTATEQLPLDMQLYLPESWDRGPSAPPARQDSRRCRLSPQVAHRARHDRGCRSGWVPGRCFARRCRVRQRCRVSRWRPQRRAGLRRRCAVDNRRAACAQERGAKENRNRCSTWPTVCRARRFVRSPGGKEHESRLHPGLLECVCVLNTRMASGERSSGCSSSGAGKASAIRHTTCLQQCAKIQRAKVWSVSSSSDGALNGPTRI